MRPSNTLRALGAAALVSGLSLTVAPSASAAPAEISGLVSFDCVMPEITDRATNLPVRFTYDATVTVKGFRDSEGSSPVTLAASMSDLPGVVPAFLSMKDQPVQVSLTGTANGSRVTLAASGTTDVNPTGDMKTKDPVELPDNIQGSVATTDADLDLVLSAFEFNVAGVGGECTAASGALGTMTPELGKAPAPAPTPTPKPTPTPSPAPTKAPKSDNKGKAAKGTVKFDCTLQTIGSPFKYHPTVTLEGARAKADDDEVTLRLAFSDIKNPDTGKGLAPVPMDGNMKITATAKVDGQDVDFSGSAPVVVGPSEPVAVPVMTKEAKISGDTVPVEITAFKFDFGTIAGTQWYSDCKGSGALSDMVIGVGELPETPPGGGGNGGGGTAPAGTTTLPKTGGGDAMPVIALWALALGVVGAGLLVWLPAQRRSAS